MSDESIDEYFFTKDNILLKVTSSSSLFSSTEDKQTMTDLIIPINISHKNYEIIKQICMINKTAHKQL